MEIASSASSASGPGSTTSRRPRPREFAQQLEEWGYRALWIPEAVGRDPFVVDRLPRRAAPTKLVFATGIANIYARDALTMRAIRETLGEARRGRFVLGLGVSHAPMVDRACASTSTASRSRRCAATSRRWSAAIYMGPTPARARADRARGAAPEDARARRATRRAAPIPTSCRPSTPRARGRSSARARWLCPEQMVLLETDATKARAIARQNMQIYLGLPNYRNNLKWLGFADADFDERRQRPAGRRDRRVGRREGDRRPHPGAPRRGRRPRLHPVVPRRRRARLRHARARGVRARAAVAGWRWRAASSGAGATRATARTRSRRAGSRATLAARFGVAVELAPAPRLEDIALPRAARRAAAARSPTLLHATTRTRARRTPTASRTATSCAARAATSRPRPTSSPSRATRPTSRRCSTGAASAASRRSRTAAARASSAASRRASATAMRARSRSTSAGSRACSRSTAPRARRASRRASRPRARGRAAPARPHAAPLPAVVRVLDARRLARDALGRPLRDALHPHRRLRRVAARRDADGCHREPAPARLGRGAEPGPAVPRLGGRARHHHRGVDAAPGPAALPRRRRRCASRRGGLRARRRRGARARAVGARADQLPPARRGRGAARRARATARAAVLVLGFETADHALDAWIARALELCRDAGGERARRRERARAPTTRRRARAPRARGATRS